MTGRGVQGTVDGKRTAPGNLALMKEVGGDTTALMERTEVMRCDGQTVMSVADHRSRLSLRSLAGFWSR